MDNITISLSTQEQTFAISLSSTTDNFTISSAEITTGFLNAPNLSENNVFTGANVFASISAASYLGLPTVSGGGGTDVSGLTGNWQNTFTTVQANSANWNYQGTDLKSLSANWQNTFTTVQANSASWGTGGSGGGSYVPLSGGTLTGNLSTTGKYSASGGSAANVAYGFNNDSNTGFYSPTADTLVLATSGIDRLTISSTGDLGIGAAPTSAKLQVYGSGDIAGAYIQTGTTSVDLLRLRNHDANGYASIGFIDDNNTTVGGFGYANSASGAISRKIYFYGANKPLLFSTDFGSTPSIYIASGTNNVGINTATPAYQLEIYKASSTLGGQIVTHNPTETVGSSYTGIGFALGNVTTAQYQKGGIYYVAAASPNNAYGRGDMVFVQQSNADSANATPANAVMTITNSGNVGIGVTTPNSKLTVNGSLSATGAAIIDTSLLVNNSFKVQSGGNDWFTIGGGDVNFNANGGTTNIGAGSLNCRINMSLISDSLPLLGLRGYSGGVSDILRISSPSSTTGDYMVVKASGNVGIKTTTPNVPLTVNGALSATGLIYTNVGQGVVLKSPNGTQYRLTVTDAGSLSAALI